jgi:hypothetical protein
LFLFIDFQNVFEFQSFVSADLFGYDRLFPSFLDFCLNALIGSACYALLGKLIRSIKFGNYILPFWFILGWWLLIESLKMLVLYSAIPLNFLDFFDLTIYSYLSLFVLGFGLFMVYSVFEFAFQTNDKSVLYLNQFVAFAAALLFIFLQKSTYFSSFYPLILVVVFQLKGLNLGTKSFILLKE